MPLPKIKSNMQKDDTSIEDLLNLNKDIDQPTKTESDKSLEKSILNKIKTN